MDNTAKAKNRQETNAKNSKKLSGWLALYRAQYQEKRDKYSGEDVLAWLDLLMVADFTNGMVSVTYSQMREAYNWTPKKVRCFFERLLKDGTLEIFQSAFHQKNEQTIYRFVDFPTPYRMENAAENEENRGTHQGTHLKNRGTHQGTNNYIGDIEFKGVSESEGHSSGHSFEKSGHSPGHPSLYNNLKKNKKNNNLTNPSTDSPRENENFALPQESENSPAEQAEPEDSGEREIAENVEYEIETDYLAEEVLEFEEPEEEKMTGEAAFEHEGEPAPEIIAANPSKIDVHQQEPAPCYIAPERPKRAIPDDLKNEWGGMRWNAKTMREVAGRHGVHHQWSSIFDGGNLKDPIRRSKEDFYKFVSYNEGRRAVTAVCDIHGDYTAMEYQCRHYRPTATLSTYFEIQDDDSVVSGCSLCGAAKHEKTKAIIETGLPEPYASAVKKAEEMIAEEDSAVLEFIRELCHAALTESGLAGTSNKLYETDCIAQWLLNKTPAHIFKKLLAKIRAAKSSGVETVNGWTFFTKAMATD